MILCVCIIALFVRHANRMRSIILYVACPAVQYFVALSQKMARFFFNKVIEYEMRVLILCTAFFSNISHCKNN